MLVAHCMAAKTKNVGRGGGNAMNRWLMIYRFATLPSCDLHHLSCHKVAEIKSCRNVPWRRQPKRAAGEQ
eukprot:COSAG04_NODE_31350_length_257_cov_0.658228_1_plen_69_part_10